MRERVRCRRLGGRSTDSSETDGVNVDGVGGGVDPARDFLLLLVIENINEMKTDLDDIL